MDEFTRRCLGIHSACRIRSRETPEVVAELMVGHVVPDYIRSDNGPETAAEALPNRLERMGHQDGLHHSGQPLGK